MFASQDSHPQIKLLRSWFCVLLVPAVLMSGCGKGGGKESPVAPTVKPTASFTRTPATGPAGVTVQFTDTSTPVGTITAWSWNFGDGGSSTLQNPPHQYAAEGSYAVSLTATSPGGSNTITTPSSVVVAPTLDQAAVNQIVQLAARYQPAVTPHDALLSTDAPRTENGFQIVTEHHDGADVVEKITDLGRNDPILWPGALIQGKPQTGDDIEKFRYVPVSGVFRDPISLSINLLSGTSGKVTKTVANPTLSTVSQGIVDLLGTAITPGTTYPARAQFDRREVHDEGHLTMRTGANFKYGVGSGSAKFDWSSTTKKTKVMATYYQEYYTISMDTPQTPAAVFSSRNTLDDIRAAIPPGTKPLYVSSVTYGMMAMCFIETDYTETQLEASLDAAYNGLSLDLEVSAGLTKKTVLENSHITTLVYGGSSAGLGSIFDGYAGFVSVVRASIHLGTAAPGVPLRYTFTNLLDNSTAQIGLTSQYSVDRRIRLQQGIRIIADHFNMDSRKNDDCGAGNGLEMDRFYLTANATQKKLPTDPGVDYFAVDAPVYTLELAGDGMDMGTNQELSCGGALKDLQLDNVTYNSDLGIVKLSIAVREYDGAGCDSDWGGATVFIPIKDLLANPHRLITSGTDQFTMSCYVRIEKLN